MAGLSKPVSLTVWVTVERHEDHRWLDVLAYDQDGFAVQVTGYALDGERARRTQAPIVWNLGPGEYRIVAVVTLADRTNRRDTAPFTVR